MDCFWSSGWCHGQETWWQYSWHPRPWYWPCCASRLLHLIQGTALPGLNLIWVFTLQYHKTILFHSRFQMVLAENFHPFLWRVTFVAMCSHVTKNASEVYCIGIHWFCCSIWPIGGTLENDHPDGKVKRWEISVHVWLSFWQDVLIQITSPQNFNKTRSADHGLSWVNWFAVPSQNLLNMYLMALGKFLNALLFVWIAVLVLRRTQQRPGLQPGSKQKLCIHSVAVWFIGSDVLHLEDSWDFYRFVGTLGLCACMYNFGETCDLLEGW